MERLRPKLITVAVIVGVGLLLSVLFKEWHMIGINQGYEPDQPINYSHKIHAGDNKIACLYCHYGAEKSRHAGIPPTGVCMNCHSVIKQDSPEIAKLSKALKEKKPIAWVKVHNLPDYVYFNHKQHVKGGVSCRDCHGSVETMSRVRQEKPLTMGWCIDCHREKGITPPEGHFTNMKKGTLEAGFRFGGMDCAKCHY